MQKDDVIHWNHSHNFGVDDKSRVYKVKIVFWLTTVIMILEITAGTWSGSMALLADGWHMGTHSTAFLITIFAYSYAKKHASNKKFSFGTGKVNYLGGFASAVALAMVALIMALESIHRFIEPQTIFFNEAIFVATIGLVVNIASVFILHDDHHHKIEEHEYHHHDHDHNMRAAYFHVLADSLTSLLAIIALLTGKYFGWIWMDAIMGVVGAVVILRWSYGLLKDSSDVLLDKTVGLDSFSEIAKDIKVENNAIISDIHVWKLGTSHQAAILSIVTDVPLEPNIYKQILKRHIPHLSHISIEVSTPTIY